MKKKISLQEGYFTINDVPPQTYNIEASFLGYGSQTKFNVIVKSVGTAGADASRVSTACVH